MTTNNNDENENENSLEDSEESATGEMFAAIPDACPECDKPMDTNVTVELRANGDPRGYFDVSCPFCGFEKDGSVGDDGGDR